MGNRILEALAGGLSWKRIGQALVAAAALCGVQAPAAAADQSILPKDMRSETKSLLASQCGFEAAYLALKMENKNVSMDQLTAPYVGNAAVEAGGLSVRELRDLLTSQGLTVQVGAVTSSTLDGISWNEYLPIIMTRSSAGDHYELILDSKDGRFLINHHGHPEALWVDREDLVPLLAGPILLIAREGAPKPKSGAWPGGGLASFGVAGFLAVVAWRRIGARRTALAAAVLGCFLETDACFAVTVVKNPAAPGRFHLDFGELVREDDVTIEFMIENPFDKAFHVGSIRESCGCTSFSLGSEAVDAGAAVDAAITVDTRGKRHGVQTGHVYILDANSSESVITLDYIFRLPSQPQLFLATEFVDLGQIVRHDEPKRRIVIERYDGTPVSFLKTDVSHEGLSVSGAEQARSAPGADKVELEIRVDPTKFAPGKSDQSVIIHTDHKQFPRLEVPVTFELKGVVSATPSSLFLGRIAAGPTQNWKMVLRSDKPVKLQSAEHSLGEGFKTSYDPRSLEVVLEFMGGRAGMVKGEVVVWAEVLDKVPYTERLAIPVSAMAIAEPEALPGTASAFAPLSTQLGIKVEMEPSAEYKQLSLTLYDPAGATIGSSYTNFSLPKAFGVKPQQPNGLAVMSWKQDGAAGRQWSVSQCCPFDLGAGSSDMKLVLPGAGGRLTGSIARVAATGDKAVPERPSGCFRLCVISHNAKYPLIFQRHLQQQPAVAGAFELDNLVPGPCTVVTIGYCPERLNVFARHHSVTLGAGENRLDLLAPAPGNGTVRGTIEVSEGHGQLAYLAFLRPARSPGIEWVGMVTDLGLPDALACHTPRKGDAAFAFKHVPEGSYTLSVVAVQGPDSRGVKRVLLQAHEEILVTGEEGKALTMKLAAFSAAASGRASAQAGK